MCQRQDSPNLEVTPEMVEAGAEAVRDVVGTEALFAGEAAKVAERVYRAMRRVSQSDL